MLNVLMLISQCSNARSAYSMFLPDFVFQINYTKMSGFDWNRLGACPKNTGAGKQGGRGRQARDLSRAYAQDCGYNVRICTF